MILRMQYAVVVGVVTVISPDEATCVGTLLQAPPIFEMLEGATMYWVPLMYRLKISDVSVPNICNLTPFTCGEKANA